jgi:uncharacterized phage-associated protein
MMKPFDFDKNAALNAVLYIVTKVPQPTFHKISKVLYFADRYHLEHYGRFICGDNYVAMKHGPVPSTLYNLLKAIRDKTTLAFDEETLAQYQNALEVQQNHYVSNKLEPNLDFLSDSDLEALNHSIKEYGHLSFTQLTDISHDDAYESSGFNDFIDVEAIAKTLPNSETLLAHLTDLHPG